MADQSKTDKEAAEELREAREAQAKAMAQEKESRDKAAADTAKSAASDEPKEKISSRMAAAAGTAAGAAKVAVAPIKAGGKALDWLWNRSSAVYRNLNFIGIAGLLFILFQAYNVITSYSNYSYRIFGAFLILFMLVFIGEAPLKAFVVAFLDFILPAALISILVAKSAPYGMTFLQGAISSVIPDFTGYAQASLILLIVAFSPSLVWLFNGIARHVELGESSVLFRLTKGAYTIFVAFVLIVFLFSMLGQAGIDAAGTVANLATLRPEGTELVANAYDFIIHSPTIVSNGINSLFRQAVTTGTGGEYFAGEIEQAKTEPVGVRIQSFQLGGLAYEQNPIVMWADLNVLTFPKEEKMTVRTKCVSDSGISEGTQNPPIEGTTSPAQFTIDLRGTQTVQCKFDSGLPKGNRMVNFTAAFDFPTESYIRAYFIERQKLVELNSEGIDPYSVYPVEEKKPVSVATQGPVKISMNIESPIGLSPREDVPLPVLGITLEPVWKGKISSISQLIVYVPNGLSLGFCDYPFSEARSLDQALVKTGYTPYELQITDAIKNSISTRPYFTVRCSLKATSPNTILKDSPFVKEFFFSRANYTFDLVDSETITVRQAVTPPTQNS